MTSITPDELKEWLGYIASDQLQGRRVYTEGLGLAAAYIADHLKEWGVKPAATMGTYFQVVKVLGVNTKSNSSVTVTVNGQSRTFKDGEGVTFPKNQGGKQTVSGNAEFVGYGLSRPRAEPRRLQGSRRRGQGRDLRGPRTAEHPVPHGFRAADATRSSCITPLPRLVRPRRGGAAARSRRDCRPPRPAAAGWWRTRRRSQTLGDFQTVQRLDNADAAADHRVRRVLRLHLQRSGQNYADFKAKADKQEPLPPVALKDVSITIDVDATYDIVQTRLTRNVVGIVEGTDPQLKDTYVLFGAHYDHIGYPRRRAATAVRRRRHRTPGGCTGQARETPRAGRHHQQRRRR